MNLYSHVHGLPSITLFGLTNDWRLLHQKVDRLQEFDNDGRDMTKWRKLLTPVLDEFIKTKSSMSNRNFWQKICHFSAILLYHAGSVNKL